MDSSRNSSCKARRVRLIFSFSRKATSSSAVRLRTRSPNMIVVWNRLKSEPWRLALRSARSISARTILFSRITSPCKACSAGLAGADPGSGTVRLRRAGADGNADESLVDVHAMELLAVGIEAYDFVVHQDFAHALRQMVLLNFQFAQNAVAAQDE